MSESVLLVERQAPIALVTLNRPDQMNALSTELRLAIGAAFRELETDADVRAVVLTGAGRAFCAGMDLKEMSSGGGEGVSGYELSVSRPAPRCARAIAELLWTRSLPQSTGRLCDGGLRARAGLRSDLCIGAGEVS